MQTSALIGQGEQIVSGELRWGSGNFGFLRLSLRVGVAAFGYLNRIRVRLSSAAGNRVRPLVGGSATPTPTRSLVRLSPAAGILSGFGHLLGARLPPPPPEVCFGSLRLQRFSHGGSVTVGDW